MRITMTLMLSGILLASTAACGSGAESGTAGAAADFSYQNRIFQNTWMITADTIKVNSNGKQVPAHPKTPTFNWPATHYKHVICAMFDEPLNIKDNVITNTDRMVWMWHSGLQAGREGFVEWSDGMADPVTDKPAIALGPGTYYWAVWALDLHGSPAGSSIENTHKVP